VHFLVPLRTRVGGGLLVAQESARFPDETFAIEKKDG
jgi:hypothetical protein